MKKTKNILVMLMAISIALVVGCQSSTWVYEYGGEQLPAGVYINMMMYSISELEQKESDAHADDEAYESPDLKKLLKMTTEGMSNSEWVRKEAEIKVAEYYAVNQKFNELGLQFESSEVDSIDSYAEYIYSYSTDLYEKNGISKNSLLLYELNDLKKDRIFNKMYGEGGEKNVSDEEMRNLFESNYFKVDLFQIPRTVGEEDEIKDNREIAEGYVSRLAAGEAVEELIYDFQILSATEEEKDAIEKLEEGAGIIILEKANAEGDPLLTTILNAEEGKAQLAEDDDNYYIFKKLNILEKDTDYEEYKEQLMYTAMMPEFEQYLRELAAGVKLNVNQSAVNKYKPEKIKVE